jgi:hypothetical protein
MPSGAHHPGPGSGHRHFDHGRKQDFSEESYAAARIPKDEKWHPRLAYAGD